MKQKLYASVPVTSYHSPSGVMSHTVVTKRGQTSVLRVIVLAFSAPQLSVKCRSSDNYS